MPSSIGPPVATYPATLSHDELVHLYRRMQGTTVVTLLTDRRSPFRQIAPLLVNKLRIAAHDKIIVDFQNSTLIVGLQASFRGTHDILESCGQVFQHVAFNNVDALAERYTSYAQLFAHYLAPAVTLEIRTCKNYALVGLFVDTFKELSSAVYTRVDIDCETGYGLIPDVRQVLGEDLKAFHYTSRDLYSLPWSRIGKSLEEIKIVIAVDARSARWRALIGNLKQYARKLASISLKQPMPYALTGPELVSFYESYGKQLTQLEIHDDAVSPGACAKIVHACPDVRITLQNKPGDFKQIPRLARHLRELRLGLNPRGDMYGAFWMLIQPLGNDDAFEHSQALKEAMVKCHGLEKLVLSDNTYGTVPNSVIETVFPMNFKYLKHLTFSPSYSVITPQSLTHIASVTSQLRSINIPCHLPAGVAGIDAIARNNRRHLEDVVITELPDYNYVINLAHAARKTAEIIQEIVRVSAKCAQLRNVAVKFRSNRFEPPSEEVLRNIVTPLRMNGVRFAFTFSPKERFFSTRIGRCKLVN